MESITETQVNLKELEKELSQGLINANNNEGDNKTNIVDSPANKLSLNLGNPVIKVFCRVKNNMQFRMVTKNLSEDVKDKLQHFNKVEDREVAIYKSALDQYGTEFLTPELIEMINKYANSPLAPLVEYEIEKFNLMKVEVKLLLMSAPKDEK